MFAKPEAVITSFRLKLASRFAATMALACGAAWLTGVAALREVLDREIESTLLSVASLQAAAVTESPTGRMAFREWELTPQEAGSIRDLNRYAQVWTEDGRSLLRTRYIDEDLPLDRDALRAAAGGELGWAEADFQGMPIRSLYYPLGRLGDAHEQHVLQVAAPVERRNRVIAAAALFLGGVVMIAMGGTFFGSWWLANRAIRPVHEIIDQAEAVTPGVARHAIVAAADTKEYRRLVDVLNRMLKRLDEAFDVQRRFTADASHELRSPLTALFGELDLALRRERPPEEYQRVIRSALEEVERLSRVSEDLLTLARSDAGAMRPRLRNTDLVECANRTVDRLRVKADAKQSQLRLDAHEPVTGLFDPDLMDRLIWNLTENAIKFTPSGGTVDVRIEAIEDRVLLSVSDTGPGIPPEDLDRVFERFFRADEARRAAADGGGSGLGLSIVRAIVNLHGGEIRVANRPERGAVFTVELPRFPSS